MTSIQAAATIAAVALAATRILTTTKPLWDKLPAWTQPLLAPAVVALTALYQGLTGAQSWMDVATAALTALALFLPGLKPHANDAKPSTGAGAATGLLLLFVAFATLSGCAAFRHVVRDANDEAATLLCADFFGKQRGISPEQARELFCATETQLKPWLDEVLTARKRAVVAANPGAHP